jgi:hypothetical protein
MGLRIALLIAAFGWAAAAIAGASSFVLVNGTMGELKDLSIRRSGTQDWKPLGNAPPAGARGPITFNDRDCAFDIRANLAGSGAVTWADVNLCDVRTVTLRHDESVGAWVDYDR